MKWSLYIKSSNSGDDCPPKCGAYFKYAPHFDRVNEDPSWFARCNAVADALREGAKSLSCCKSSYDNVLTCSNSDFIIQQ